VWTLADPAGGASVAVSDGTASVSLPAGSIHDVWGNVNTSSGLRQPAPDRDFEIEAKFASAVGSGFQMRGLIVERDANDLVRAEVHHDGGGTRLFVATMFVGNPRSVTTRRCDGQRRAGDPAGAGPARNRIASTTSSGWPRRPSGWNGPTASSTSWACSALMKRR
jgi:hypothetical protein